MMCRARGFEASVVPRRPSPAPPPHRSECCTGTGLFNASATSLSNSASRSGANLDTSARQRRTCSTAMNLGVPLRGCFPAATAYAWPAIKVYQP